jgi:hypothetical protein
MIDYHWLLKLTIKIEIKIIIWWISVDRFEIQEMNRNFQEDKKFDKI